MKKVLAVLVLMALLSVSVFAAEITTILDPNAMKDGAQVTQMPTFFTELVSNSDGTKSMHLYLKDNEADGWGWLIFDEYSHKVNWADYSGMVVHVRNTTGDPIEFGLNGMTDGGQTARIEFQQNGTIARTLDGKDVSSSVTTRSMGGGTEAEWGNGDPAFTVPAGFDGYYFFPFSGAFLDDDCDLKTINTMAAFLYTATPEAGVYLDNISLYKGTAEEAYAILVPPVVETIPETVVVPEAPVVAEVAPVATAPQTRDGLVGFIVLFALALAGGIVLTKKGK